MKVKYCKAVSVLTVIVVLSGCTTLLEDIKNVFASDPPSVERDKPVTASETKTPSENESTQIIIAENGPFRGEFARTEEQIFELVNEERARNGLQPLIVNSQLAVVAREHSADMGERGFYSHVDPDGLTPNDRITAALGDTYYLAGTSENIAYFESSRGFSQVEHTAIARQFMNGWMNSPGHRANILRERSTHIGIGLQSSGNRIYATQKFMRYVVTQDESASSGMVSASDPIIRFHLNPGLNFSRSDFVVRVSLPDPSARWTTDNGSFYEGIMFADPVWVDDTVVDIALPVEYGPGTYHIHFGIEGGTATSTGAFVYTVQE